MNNRKNISGFLAGTAMLVFALLVLIWTTSNTYTFLGRILGEDNLIRYLGVVLFDGGLVFWLCYHLFAAKGTEQRGISLAMAVVDFLGAALLTAAEIFMGGQTIADIPPQLGTIAVWAVGVYTVLNGGALLATHLADPGAKSRAANQDIDDEIDQKVLERRRELVGEIVAEVSDVMAHRDVVNTLNRLGVSVKGYNTGALPAGRTVDHDPNEKVGQNGTGRSRNPFRPAARQYAANTEDRTDRPNAR